MMLTMGSIRDEFSFITPYVRFARETTQHEPLVVVTNVIINGRIAGLSATSVLSRSLVVRLLAKFELSSWPVSSNPQPAVSSSLSSRTVRRKHRFCANRFEALSQIHFALRHCRSCQEPAKTARHRPRTFAG